jgi:spore maturation protein B
VPFALMRPISGSGAMAIVQDIFTNYSPDSFIGRCASVMMGSTETTFYTIAVYYGSVGIHKVRHTVKAALVADVVGMLAAVYLVSLILGQ